MLDAEDGQQQTVLSSENTASPPQSSGAATALIIINYPISHHSMELVDQRQIPDSQNMTELLRPKSHCCFIVRREKSPPSFSDRDSFEPSPRRKS